MRRLTWRQMRLYARAAERRRMRGAEEMIAVMTGAALMKGL